MVNAYCIYMHYTKNNIKNKKLIQENKNFKMEEQEKNTEEHNTQNKNHENINQHNVNEHSVDESNQSNSKENKSSSKDQNAKIQELSEKNEILKDKLLRQMAESENIRNRGEKLAAEAREYAVFNFAKDLIPVMDNLSRALEHLPDNLSDDVKNIAEGVKMTKKELKSVFDKNLLESIAPQSGEKFDYNAHHAISQVVTDEYESGNIVNTMQIGYKLKDRLIRPAVVTVAKKA